MMADAISKLCINSIYVILTRMVARGFLKTRIEAEKEKSKRGPARRLYMATDYGLQMYKARMAAEKAVAEVIAAGGHKKPDGAL